MANEQNLKPFVKGQIANPNGRPKRSFTQAKELGFSKDDVIACYKLYIAKTIDELKSISNSKELSALEAIVISGLLSDISKGNMENIEKILNRAVGTPKSEITNTNLNVDSNSEIDMNKIIELQTKLNKIVNE